MSGEAQPILQDDEDLSDIQVDKDIKYAIALSASCPEDPYILQRAMSVQQYDMLDALSELQTIKTVKAKQAQAKHTTRGSLAALVNHGDSSRIATTSSTSSVSRQKGATSTDSKKPSFSLAMKLDVLEELLENSRMASDTMLL
jgi:hypothetical protein